MTTIALVGASGAGKSTVGRLLARRLSLPLVDVDAEVERASGRTIRDIFASDGEAAFRALERDAALAALQAPGVVSLGGGAPMTPEVADALRRAPHVVWMRVSPEVAARRIGHDPRRPLLGGDVATTIAAMLTRRSGVYESVATVTIETDGQSAGRSVAAIMDALGVGGDA